MISITMMAGIIIGTNLCEYKFIFKNKQPVRSCIAVEAVLPNGDRVQIPSFNGKVPVMYIHAIGIGQSELVLDFDDDLCKPIGSSKVFSYQTGDVGKESFLDTFSSIQKQIDSIKSINKKDGDEQSKLLMSLSRDIKELSKDTKELPKDIKELPKGIIKLSKDIEELKAMIANTQQTLAGTKQNDQDLGKSFNDIKLMISEVRKELVGIQQKLAKQADKPNDIIEPNLPILDKAGAFGNK